MGRESFIAFRLAETLRIRQERLKLSLGSRLDDALRRAESLSNASGETRERTSKGKPGSSVPARPNGLFYQGDDSPLDHYTRRLRLMVEKLEREVDAHYVRPVEADLARETMEEKERRLSRDFEGIPSWEVSFLDPTFGSPRTVERTRVKLGLRPGDGRRIESDAA